MAEVKMTRTMMASRKTARKDYSTLFSSNTYKLRIIVGVELI